MYSNNRQQIQPKSDEKVWKRGVSLSDPLNQVSSHPVNSREPNNNGMKVNNRWVWDEPKKFNSSS